MMPISSESKLSCATKPVYTVLRIVIVKGSAKVVNNWMSVLKCKKLGWIGARLN